jgi:E3 ubiquitin-protein ligase FANCL
LISDHLYPRLFSLQVAPLIIPLDSTCSSVEGFISASASGPQQSLNQQHWVRLTGIAPSTGSLQDAQLELDQPTRDLLGPQSLDLAYLRLKESPNAASFLVELRNLLAQATTAATASTSAINSSLSLRNPSFYQTLKHDLDSLGSDIIHKLADDLSSVTLKCIDMAGRTHFLSLALPPTFPATPPKIISADLPVAITLHRNPTTGLLTLHDALHQFEDKIKSFQRFWDILDDLDHMAWIIEPTAPTRSCTYRRVALEKHVTLTITLDPLDLDTVPELHFMGSDRAVQPILSTVRMNRTLWQPAGLLRENLCALLGAPLPEKNSNGEDRGIVAEDVGAECAICYNYRRPVEGEDGDDGGEDVAMAVEQQGILENNNKEDQGDVPEINCDNAACGKPFHRLCLREWLAADATTRQSFDTLFGACPYCSSPIAVKTR